MKQQEMYAKNITRSINGVISAGAETELSTEVQEYVITAEQMLPKMLPALFETLVPQSKLTGVWIAGDFGSGKSHLLKILSYVLENQIEIDGRKCSEIFAEKAANDFELCELIKKACRVPTECILFDIQEKMDAVAKLNSDPVLPIFLKEFNRKLGFDAKKPEVAEVERQLVRDGLYEQFKQEYLNRFGRTWEEDRPSITLKLHQFAEVYAGVMGITKDEAARNLEVQLKTYKLTTDDFISLVNEYLDSRPAGLRLIFFVDEVGQFIGNDVGRMLSLQTIAEGLVQKTKGRATLIVTSQMDIDATLGNLEKQQQNDFSRIQGRFTTRLSLTSANAEEVIQRRLLEKTPEANRVLCGIYNQEKNAIKTLFNFGDACRFLNNYKSENQFAVDFPFMDYQFDLLKISIVELSKNNAFTGRQQSVGERSLLSITQDVAKSYKDKDTNYIVRFCDMYEGIRGILQTKIQTDIMQAEKTLDDTLALDALKALFLVKYVKGFPTTVDNIAKLILPSFSEDFPAYRNKVQEALNKLVMYSYIDKGANEEYHYQTNEEKDVETEIKNEELSPNAVNDELKKIFRDEIFSESKIRLDAQKIFTFGRIVDEKIDGKEDEISIHFISPLNTSMDLTEASVCAYSLQNPRQLCVVLGEDRNLAEDLVMYKKADKCLTRMLSANSDPYRMQIVSDKRRINAQRYRNITNKLVELTKSARLYVSGTNVSLQVRGSDVKARLNEGMGLLVSMVYVNLNMLKVEYNDAMLKTIINSTSTGILEYAMDNCTTEVLNYINKCKIAGNRVKVKDLVDYFSKNTYGWYSYATLCNLAKLYKMDKISFRFGGNIVEEGDLYACLTNSNQQANTIVDVEETITSGQISSLKKLYKDFFENESCSAQGAKEVHAAFVARLDKEIGRLETVINQHSYEFVKPLDEICRILRQIKTSVYPALYSMKETLEKAADKKVNEADVIVQFVEGNQFAIFKQIDTCKNGNQANFGYIDQDRWTRLNEIYVSKNPWDLMEEAKKILEEISSQIRNAQDAARKKLYSKIDKNLQNLKNLPSYGSLPSHLQNQIEKLFESIRAAAKDERFIGNLEAMHTKVDCGYTNSLGSINKWIEDNRQLQEQIPENSSGEPKKEVNEKGSTYQVGVPEDPKLTKPVKTLMDKKDAMSVNFGKNLLETRDDVERYVNMLRDQLMNFIESNNIVL